jgi:IS5 family transposase
VGDHVGASPVDRGKPGSKLHLVCDAAGLPPTVVVTAANVNDTTMFEAIIDDLPAVRTPAGRRGSRPGAVHADKGYDGRVNRAYLRHRRLTQTASQHHTGVLDGRWGRGNTGRGPAPGQSCAV